MPRKTQTDSAKVKPDSKLFKPLKSHFRKSANTFSLAGKCLLSVPGIDDARFDKSVIYVCADAKEGSMGIIVNRPIIPVKFDELLKHLDIKIPSDKIIKEPDIVFGGPIESSRGFVLHSADYFLASTVTIDSGIAVTSTLDILEAIATGKGPSQCIIALGYVSWSEGQLEEELRGNVWLVSNADKELIFETPYAKKWQKAMKNLGVDTNLFSSAQGTA